MRPLVSHEEMSLAQNNSSWNRHDDRAAAVGCDGPRSPMGDSNSHGHKRLPILLAGHANGALEGNLHHVATEGTPHANTLLTVMCKLGMQTESISDSTGTLPV